MTYQAMEHIFMLVSVLSVSDTDIKEAFDKRWRDFEENQLEVITFSDFIEQY